MGWISMSERDLRRIEVLSDVRAGRWTVAAAAAVLAVSERQAYRLLARYEADGGSGLIHKARGRTSNRSTRLATFELAITNSRPEAANRIHKIVLERELIAHACALRRW
jgi:transposase